MATCDGHNTVHFVTSVKIVLEYVNLAFMELPVHNTFRMFVCIDTL